MLERKIPIRSATAFSSLSLRGRPRAEGAEQAPVERSAKCNMIETESREIAFITRTGANNGVGTYVENIDGVSPYPAGCLTVALGGSLGSTFLQPKPFYTAQNVAVLIPRTDKGIKWSNALKLFLATLIKKESNLRFVAFGRELNTHIKKDFCISLPFNDNEIDWDAVQSVLNEIPSDPLVSKNSSLQTLDVSDWKLFKIKELFPKNNRERGKVHSRDLLPEGDSYYYIGAKKKCNGVEEHCGYDSSLISKGNCIVFICNGQCSVGYTLYMDRDFMASGDLVLCYNDHLNKYSGLFMVAVLDKERFKYSFGRKYGKYLPETEILLPTQNGVDPDWEYMENFIKGLPYGDLI